MSIRIRKDNTVKLDPDVAARGQDVDAVEGVFRVVEHALLLLVPGFEGAEVDFDQPCERRVETRWDKEG